jgi:hypothetical protein
MSGITTSLTLVDHVECIQLTAISTHDSLHMLGQDLFELVGVGNVGDIRRRLLMPDKVVTPDIRRMILPRLVKDEVAAGPVEHATLRFDHLPLHLVLGRILVELRGDGRGEARVGKVVGRDFGTKVELVGVLGGTCERGLWPTSLRCRSDKGQKGEQGVSEHGRSLIVVLVGSIAVVVMKSDMPGPPFIRQVDDLHRTTCSASVYFSTEYPPVKAVR